MSQYQQATNNHFESSNKATKQQLVRYK